MSPFGKNKFLFVCFGALVMMFIQYPKLLGQLFPFRQEFKMQDFNAGKIGRYSESELTSYLSSKHQAMPPASIVAIAEEISRREKSTDLESKKLICENSLLNVSQVLSETQQELRGYKEKEEAIPFGKIAIFLLTSAFAFCAHLLSKKKEEFPDKAKLYEDWSANLNLISIVVLGLLGVFFS